MHRRFPFLDANVSYSFLGDKNMFEWPQITKPYQRRLRVHLFYSKERRVVVIGLDNNIPLATIVVTTPTQLSNSGAPKTSHLDFESPMDLHQQQKCAYTHVPQLVMVVSM